MPRWSDRLHQRGARPSLPVTALRGSLEPRGGQAGLSFQREKPVVPTGWFGTVPWYIGTPSCSGEMPNRAPQTPSCRRCCLARAGLTSCATALSSSPPVVARSSHRGHVSPRHVAQCSYWRLATMCSTAITRCRARRCELIPLNCGLSDPCSAARSLCCPYPLCHVGR